MPSKFGIRKSLRSVKSTVSLKRAAAAQDEPFDLSALEAAVNFDSPHATDMKDAPGVNAFGEDVNVLQRSEDVSYARSFYYEGYLRSCKRPWEARIDCKFPQHSTYRTSTPTENCGLPCDKYKDMADDVHWAIPETRTPCDAPRRCFKRDNPQDWNVISTDDLHMEHTEGGVGCACDSCLDTLGLESVDPLHVVSDGKLVEVPREVPLTTSPARTISSRASNNSPAKRPSSFTNTSAAPAPAPSVPSSVASSVRGADDQDGPTGSSLRRALTGLGASLSRVTSRPNLKGDTAASSRRDSGYNSSSKDAL